MFPASLPLPCVSVSCGVFFAVLSVLVALYCRSDDLSIRSRSSPSPLSAFVLVEFPLVAHHFVSSLFLVVVSLGALRTGVLLLPADTHIPQLGKRRFVQKSLDPQENLFWSQVDARVPLELPAHNCHAWL